MLTPSAKLWLKKGKFSVLGSGRASLLHAIENLGSITKASKTMNMSYRHAWGIIKHMEDSLGEKIVKTSRGGAHGGGGAALTDLGKEILGQFEKNEREIEKIMRYGPRPALAVDGVIFDQKNLILIRRKNPPYKGQLALPGGFVEYNETTEEAVMREIKEELGIDTKIKRLIGVYSEPARDPREHVVSVVYELEPLSKKFRAGDDAAAVESIPIKELERLDNIAFDHSKIISDALTGIVNK